MDYSLFAVVLQGVRGGRVLSVLSSPSAPALTHMLLGDAGMPVCGWSSQESLLMPGWEGCLLQQFLCWAPASFSLFLINVFMFSQRSCTLLSAHFHWKILCSWVSYISPPFRISLLKSISLGRRSPVLLPWQNPGLVFKHQGYLHQPAHPCAMGGTVCVWLKCDLSIPSPTSSTSAI